MAPHESRDDIQFLTDGRTITHHCRACGATASARVYARVAAAQQPDGWAEWVACPVCKSCSAIGLEPPAYEEDQPISASALKYYVEQNAAIDVLASLIAGIRRRGPTRILDVGCGFGFLLDYARGALGWDPQGIDPSTFARAGQEALGLPIAFEYLSDENASRFAADVIVCSEIIEHLPGPDAFLATLRKTLRPGGALVMTTPSSRCAAPDAGLDPNILAYAPGQHIIVYSQQGLEAALRRAGFAHVEVREAGGIHLIAAASMADGAVDLSARVDAAGFRRWLSRRADSTKDASLEIGLRGRLLKLSVAAGAWDEARAAAGDVARIFAGAGLDLSRPDELQPPEADGFIAYALLAPCNAGSVFFHLGRIAEEDGDIVRAESLFRAAIRFGTALNDHLREVPALDLETAGQVVAATARAAAFRALRDPAGAARELDALGEAAFGPEGCPPNTFLYVIGRAIHAGLDVSPLEAACCSAIARAPGYDAGQLWLSMALAAFRNDDAAMAARVLERIPDGPDAGLAADKHRLADEAQKRLLLAALGEGRMEDAAKARDHLSCEARQADDLAEALGLVALNHDRQPLVAAELFRRSANAAKFRRISLSQALVSAVAGGRLEEARSVRSRLSADALEAPALQLALGLLALNGDDDPPAALRHFEASNEGSAKSLKDLARRRIFTDLCLSGQFAEAEPMAEEIKVGLERTADSRDPELGRAWAALALLARLQDKNATDARRYASRAIEFDIDPALLDLLRRGIPELKE